MSWRLAVLGVWVHVVREMVIVAANRVIVVVTAGHNHSTILTGRWAIVAHVIIGIVAIPHVDSLVVCSGITPSGCSIVDFHLPADRGRGGLFPASGLHALVLFAIAPVGCVLLHRAWTTP